MARLNIHISPRRFLAALMLLTAVLLMHPKPVCETPLALTQTPPWTDARRTCQVTVIPQREEFSDMGNFVIRWGNPPAPGTHTHFPGDLVRETVKE